MGPPVYFWHQYAWGAIAAIPRSAEFVVLFAFGLTLTFVFLCLVGGRPGGKR